MSATSVRGAAERLKLASGVGGLGDVTRHVDVPQTFDHNLLTPALREISRGLRVDKFKGDDASVARWLKRWIQHLQRNRDERDRKRRARAVEKQAREAAAKEVHEREEREKKRVQEELAELREREIRERGERQRMRAEEELKEQHRREEREGVEAAIKELQKNLAAVLHYRPVTPFQLEGVRVKPSKVHGHGLFSTVRVEAGSDVFVAVLPDCGKEQGYTPDMYNDYVHVAHKDGQSAALIDAGSTVVGILGACHEDVKAGYIRAMNHASVECDATVLLDLREACVPDWYFPAGEVVYTVWYACHVIAKRAIEPGDELRFEYAWTPKGWK